MEMVSTSARESHFEGHVEQVMKQAEQHGYTGVELSSSGSEKRQRTRAVIPRQCIFCLHDETLSAEGRIGHVQFYRYQECHKIHIDNHVKSIGSRKIYCPASAAVPPRVKNGVRGVISAFKSGARHCIEGTHDEKERGQGETGRR